jgi:hypothetical protein
VSRGAAGHVPGLLGCFKHLPYHLHRFWGRPNRRKEGGWWWGKKGRVGRKWVAWQIVEQFGHVTFKYAWQILEQFGSRDLQKHWTPFSMPCGTVGKALWRSPRGPNKIQNPNNGDCACSTIVNISLY